MAGWLVKTEPDTYSFDDLWRAGRDTWDGVRNPQARAFLRQMRPGDRVLVYHTGTQRAVVGLAEVASPPYPDPGDPGGVVVDLRALARLPRPVPLAALRTHPDCAGWLLLRQPRLSVLPVDPAQWQAVLALAGVKDPRAALWHDGTAGEEGTTAMPPRG